jgi:hypothetical protein
MKIWSENPSGDIHTNTLRPLASWLFSSNVHESHSDFNSRFSIKNSHETPVIPQLPDAVHRSNDRVKIYLTSSREIYGTLFPSQDEKAPFHPLSLNIPAIKHSVPDMFLLYPMELIKQHFS